ncbi:MAG TPA: transposase [Bradyrhizobium sp.]|nr:transposase [Bradyrhizobium sp.]
MPIDGHSFRRVEVLTGAPRRRRWSVAEKAAIVAESLAPGAIASTVALRHGLHRNQLYMWRREVRSGALAQAGAALPDFVPIVAESRAVSRTAAIEIEISGAVLRVDAGVELAFLGRIVRLLKAT